MTRRSPWGSVRRLGSGRFQARYRVRRVEHLAPRTFPTKREAHAFLAATRTDIERGGWVNVDAGRVALNEYAERWLRERPLLRPRTRELYEGLLRLHVLPTLGPLVLSDLKPALIRAWHAGLLSGPRPGASTAAKSYRLLRSILATAVDDEVILKNPCRVRGAGVEHPQERPIATIEQVYALADAIEPRYRALVLTAAFTALRLGELRALKRQHLDLLHATVHVAGQLQELKDGTLVLAPPKTAASVRTVSIPAVLIPELEEQLAHLAAPGFDGFVFPGTKDQPFRRASLYTAWRRATRAVGVDELHFHDLRHTGATLAAATGATTKELMARMGHASPRAALIYQHATQERDQAIARALSDAIARATPLKQSSVIALQNARSSPSRS
jgi:integrase